METNLTTEDMSALRELVRAKIDELIVQNSILAGELGQRRLSQRRDECLTRLAEYEALLQRML